MDAMSFQEEPSELQEVLAKKKNVLNAWAFIDLLNCSLHFFDELQLAGGVL
jgi:hypothetical protein